VSAGPLPPPATCPIGWQPQALAPVFFGARTLEPAEGAPVPLRIFFPSLDGAVESAPLLEGCGTYPLIVLAHGHCPGDPENFRRWFRLPAQLARSGYVVVVPVLAGISAGGHPSGDTGDLATLAAVVSWVRTHWEGAATVTPAPATGVIGHSFGGLLGALFTAQNEVSAFAGLSGVWQDWPSRPIPIEEVTVPTLLVWGGPLDLFTQLPDSIWDALPRPKHRVVFAQGEHWDYLGAQEIPCQGGGPGPCPGLGTATDDLVTMFFGKHLPPELATDLPDRIPATLVPPPLDGLSFEQEFFAGGFLNGFGGLGGDACAVDIDGELARLVANRRTRETHSLDAPCAWVSLISASHRMVVDTRPAGFRWCDFCFPDRADG
jgi:dienelactone hydrolase